MKQQSEFEIDSVGLSSDGELSCTVTWLATEPVAISALFTATGRLLRIELESPVAIPYELVRRVPISKLFEVVNAEARRITQARGSYDDGAKLSQFDRIWEANYEALLAERRLNRSGRKRLRETDLLIVAATYAIAARNNPVSPRKETARLLTERGFDGSHEVRVNQVRDWLNDCRSETVDLLTRPIHKRAPSVLTPKAKRLLVELKLENGEPTSGEH